MSFGTKSNSVNNKKLLAHPRLCLNHLYRISEGGGHGGGDGSQEKGLEGRQDCSAGGQPLGQPFQRLVDGELDRRV